MSMAMVIKVLRASSELGRFCREGKDGDNNNYDVNRGDILIHVLRRHQTRLNFW
jgi:hypothetical protein